MRQDAKGRSYIERTADRIRLTDTVLFKSRLGKVVDITLNGSRITFTHRDEDGITRQTERWKLNPVRLHIAD